MRLLANLYEMLGHRSERLLDQIAGQGSQCSVSGKDDDGFRAKVRGRQLAAVSSLTTVMMIANIANAFGLVILLVQAGNLSIAMMLWAGIVWGFAIYTLIRLYKHRKRPARETASLKAIGAAVFHATFLALLWSVPSILLLHNADLIVIGFVSALVGGMVAGGAIALYPIPLAAFSYTLLLSCISLFSLAISQPHSSISFAIVCLMFILVTVRSISNHAGLFMSEMRQRIDLQEQSDVINILLKEYDEHGAHWLWECNSEFQMENCSPRLAEVTGMSIEEINALTTNRLTEALNITILDQDDQTIHDWSYARSIKKAPGVFEIRVKVAPIGQKVSYWEIQGNPRYDSDGVFKGYRGSGSDITKTELANQRIHYLATRDEMTGLLNASEFAHKFDAKISELRDLNKKDMWVSVLYLDADKLKVVNDTYGHHAGDALIIELGKRLQSFASDTTIVGRKSGDEFQMAMFHSAELDIEQAAQEILTFLTGSFQFETHEIALTTSIGLSSTKVMKVHLQSIMAKADRALYHAKASGGQVLQVYDAKLGAALARQRQLATEIRNALLSNSLTVHFQPIVSVEAMQLAGYEALMRWHHPDFGDIDPEELSELAEATGFMHDLGRYILAKAMEKAAAWPGALGLSVNVSVLQLMTAGFPEMLRTLLERYDFAAGRLTLEIVETRELHESPTTLNNLNEIREMGVSIAIDDFGKGYSAIDYLSKYPITSLKIDASLIRDCDSIKVRHAVIKSIVGIAQALEISTVAEGVETPEQLSTLQRLGCTHVQGFLLGKPGENVDPADVAQQIARCQRKPIDTDVATSAP